MPHCRCSIYTVCFSQGFLPERDSGFLEKTGVRVFSPKQSDRVLSCKSKLSSGLPINTLSITHRQLYSNDPVQQQFRLFLESPNDWFFIINIFNTSLDRTKV